MVIDSIISYVWGPCMKKTVDLLSNLWNSVSSLFLLQKHSIVFVYFFIKFAVKKFNYKRSDFPLTRTGLVNVFRHKGDTFVTRFYRENSYSFKERLRYLRSIYIPALVYSRQIDLPSTITVPVGGFDSNSPCYLFPGNDYWFTSNRDISTFQFSNSEKPKRITLTDSQDSQSAFNISPFTISRLKVDELTRMSMESENVLVGAFPLGQEVIHHVHYLFVDTLYEFSELVNSKLNDCFKVLFESGMRYFKLNNLISSSDWTMPSLATMLTGLPTHKHGVVDPGSNRAGRTSEDCLSDSINTLFEDVSSEGFFNVALSANPRFNPFYGYVSGIHRFIHKPYLESSTLLRFAEDESINYSDRSSFFFIGLMDLHHRLNGFDLQTDRTIKRNLDSPETNSKAELIGRSDDTVFFRSDYYAIARNLATQIARYIRNVSLSNKDVKHTFILTSDHSGAPSPKAQKAGQKLPERFHVPFLVFSSNLEADHEGLDYYIGSAQVAQLLSKSFVNKSFDVNRLRNNLVRQKFSSELVYSEVIYPSQTYRAQIFTDSHIFQIESNEVVKNRVIDLRLYQLKTYERASQSWIENNATAFEISKRFINDLKIGSSFEIIV